MGEAEKRKGSNSTLLVGTLVLVFMVLVWLFAVHHIYLAHLMNAPLSAPRVVLERDE